MITLIVGTNRPNSRARRVATLYATLLHALGAETQLLDLAHLPADALESTLYHNAGQHEAFNHLAASLDASAKVVFFVPEYNCSFPGALKLFIDGLPYRGGLRGKKAALVGLGTGSQGGSLALSHLTDVLMYLDSAVLPQRVRLPFIDKELTADGQLATPLLMELLRTQAAALLAF
ncbi:NADPH-dependent FMN reductase [Hymenobacter nivis]|uniref:NADPH-dependent oxidoreductase n=1 Tax=Hymenobacter nivis TaxID=1850093 RepID=A0A502HE33_9BACT|nr:NAD(P)H-dependent oxidoreductase [Hymenobacter nivis]TPG71935.1 NADPH-dependent oxidoreductase [Hymenobacter nivis]